MRMVIFLYRKVFSLSLVLLFAFCNSAFVHATTPPKLQIQEFASLFDMEPLYIVAVDKNSLPKPYDFLLTQPLMTVGLERHYQREGKIKVIFAKKNEDGDTYSRAILMLMDSNQARNNVEKAQAKKEEIIVELGLITMNFRALPKNVIDGVLNSNLPFGKLLMQSHVKTYSQGQSYFAITCNSVIEKWLRCKRNDKLYGRTNILMAEANKQWLAKVIEIIPALQCSEKECHPVKL